MLTENGWTVRQLLPGHEFVARCYFDDGARFVKLFRDTWRQLPLRVRREILRFWRDSPNGSPPLIELSNMWAPAAAFGQVREVGMQLRFRQEAFACFPTAAAQWIIAHELAHVYQKACGRRPGGEDERE